MLARFIPLVRTVLNPMAGTVGIPVRVFTPWQVVGGLVWSIGLTLAGYALGSRIPNVDKYLLPIVAVIIVVSLIPVALEVRRSRARAAADLLQRVLEAPGDHHALHLVGALVDLGDLGVAHHPLDREVLRVAGPAEQLDGVRGHLHGDVGRERLGRGRRRVTSGRPASPAAAAT